MKITRTPVKSSQIASIGYSEPSKELDIEFTNRSKTPRPPSVYRYSNITPDLHAKLIGAESIGTFFGKEIKPLAGSYPFRKLTQEELAE